MFRDMSNQRPGFFTYPQVIQLLVVLDELVEFLLHLLGGLGKPLLVEIVHQNDLIVNQRRADGRAETFYWSE